MSAIAHRWRKHEEVRRLAANQKALQIQPARSLYLLAQAIELSRNGRHGEYLKESVEILKRAWRISPEDCQISGALGSACESRTDRIRFCTAAVTAKPKSSITFRSGKCFSAWCSPRKFNVVFH